MTRLRTAAVIGLGAMGREVARRLLQRGHRVVVWNRSPGPVDELATMGAQPAADPAAAARAADLTVTMVTDDEALRAVTEGPGGVAAGIEAGTLLQMSTVGAAALRRLTAVLPAQAVLLDAPVLGSIAEAKAGTLHLFVGGDPTAIERHRVTLDALGTPIHVGPVGSGTAAKLVANSALFGVLTLLGETLALAGRMGLPFEDTLRILERTPLGAQAERRRPAVVSGEYPVRFALPLALKDAHLILDAAAEHGVDLRLGAAARAWLADADAARDGNCDYTAVLGHILDRHPAVPIPPPSGDAAAHDSSRR